MTYSLLAAQAKKLAEIALSKARLLTPETLGLGPQVAPAVWVGDDFLAVRQAYGYQFLKHSGFQYAHPEHQVSVYGITFYSAEDPQVGGVLRAWHEKGD